MYLAEWNHHSYHHIFAPECLLTSYTVVICLYFKLLKANKLRVCTTVAGGRFANDGSRASLNLEPGMV